MGVVLQVLGGLCLLVTALVVIGFLVARAKLRKFVKNLGDAAGAGVTPPAQIHLVFAPDESWDDPDVVPTVAAFKGLGYQRGHAYRIPESMNIIVLPFVSPEQDAYGVLYNLEGKVWSEFVSLFTDGTRITVTSSPFSSGIRTMPGHTKIDIQNASVEELHRRFVQERPLKEIIPATIDDFKSAVERTYAEEMAWRATQDPSEEEIAAVVARDGQSLTPEEMGKMKSQLARQANEQLGDALRAEFLANTTMSAKEWSEVEERLVFVHNRLSREELEEIVESWLEVEAVEFPAGAAREAFAQYNGRLPFDRQFRDLGEVRKPIEADVYAAPELE